MPERAEFLACPFDVRSRSVQRRAKVERLALATGYSRENAGGTEIDGSAVLKAMIDEQIDLRSGSSSRDETNERYERGEKGHVAMLLVQRCCHAF